MDPETIRAIAEALSQQLTPVLPYLFTLRDKAWEEVGKKLGGGAVEGVKKLWGKVLETPDAEKAAKKLAEGDSRRAGAFEAEIEDILRADAGLAETLATALEAAGIRVLVQGSGAAAVNGGVAAGKGGVAVGRDHYGDIHIGGQEGGKTDEASLRQAYLRRLMHDLGFLDLSGVDRRDEADQETRLKLHAVYTALLTESAADDARLMDLEPRRQSALAQLNDHKYLVLLGDPGSGKSTFVNFVALCLAGEFLGYPDIHLKLLTRPLPGDDHDEFQSWEHGRLLPVRVVLRDLAAGGLPEAGAKADASHLWQFIEASLQEKALGDFAPFLKEELRDQGGLILLDGLDEVPQAERRREQIREVVEGFAGSFGKCRVLVTSRTYAYQDPKWRLRRFSSTVLAPFTGEQISRFVVSWYDHVASLGRIGASQARSRAEWLNRVISTSPRLRELAERPLLLTLMASLHAWRGGTLPEKRAQLYDEAVDLLLDRWERRRSDVQEPSLAEWLKLDSKGEILKTLRRLAFEAHKGQPDLSGTADIAEGELVSALMRINRNPEAESNPARLLDYLWHRTGLLIERRTGTYTFPHRTFQEYLAACHLTTREFPQQVADLARKDPNRWREVALLAGAKADMPVNIWSLAEALCWREPDDPRAGTEDVWGAHLAGQILGESVDVVTVGESGPDRQKLERLQRWHLRLIGEPGLPATERALAGKTLARLGDPRFRRDLWFLPGEPWLGFVEIPEGRFLMGSSGRFDSQTHDDERKAHWMHLPTYYMARYPVTVAQFRAYLSEMSGVTEVREELQGADNHPVVNVTWGGSSRLYQVAG